MVFEAYLPFQHEHRYSSIDDERVAILFGYFNHFLVHLQHTDELHLLD